MLCVIVGGNWNNSTNAGVGAVNWNNARSNSNTNVGFRSDYRAIIPRAQMMGMWTYRDGLPCLGEIFVHACSGS